MTAYPVTERDNFRWTILALISVSHVIGATAQYSINTLAPFYQDDLGLSRAQIGLFISAFYLAMTGASFGAGWLTDRLGVRRTTSQGHLFLGLFTMAASLAPSFAWAFGSFFLAGLGYSFLNPSSTKGVMAWFYRDERATAMGIKQTGVPAGGVAVAMMAPPLVLIIGWRGALAALGVINFLFAFLFSSLWREPREERNVTPSQRPSTPGSQRPLNVMSFLPASFGTAVFLVGQMSLITYLPLYLKETIGFSSYWASQALALTQGGAMVGRIGWGVASDRLFAGRRKTVLVLICWIGVALIIGLSFMTRHSSMYLLLPIVFFVGVCLVGYQGVSYALIGELGGKARAGIALGIMVTVNAAAATVGTPLFGYLVDRTGSYAIAWQALAGTLFVGTLALSFFVSDPSSESPHR
jgi:sugar phosphate permease